MRLLAALACSSALLAATLAPSVTTGASAEEQPTAAQQVLAEARTLLTGTDGEGPAARRSTGEPGAHTSREATLVLRDLRAALPRLGATDRAAAESLLARPTDGRADPEGTGYTTKSQRRCRGHFCVHYVTSTSDRATSAWVDKTLKVMKKVWQREVGDLGYRAPLSDGALPSSRNGGNGKFDVYLADVGADLLYGYCSADFVLRKDRTRAGGYCVLDNDFSKDQYGGKPGKTLAVTAAHEFFHAIQFGYDYYEDRWFMESTATWVEERFADGVNDNRQYLAFGQVAAPDTSLDLFERGGFAHYGNWPFWEHLSEGTAMRSSAGPGPPPVAPPTPRAPSRRCWRTGAASPSGSPRSPPPTSPPATAIPRATTGPLPSRRRPGRSAAARPPAATRSTSTTWPPRPTSRCRTPR